MALCLEYFECRMHFIVFMFLEMSPPDVIHICSPNASKPHNWPKWGSHQISLPSSLFSYSFAFVLITHLEIFKDYTKNSKNNIMNPYYPLLIINNYQCLVNLI